MPNSIVIERLEFRGRCGVTPDERAVPQPLAIDLELHYQPGPMELADDLRRTIDYAEVSQRVVDIGTSQDSCLLETLAERLITMLFDAYPAERISLWVRKLHPPIAYVTGSVGVSIERTRLAQRTDCFTQTPSRFLAEQLHRLPKGRALDVAAGNGRHTLFLASHGYDVDAIDRNGDTLKQLSTEAQSYPMGAVSTRNIDLEQPPPHEPDLGTDAYDVILVFFYLHRPLFPRLIEALKPGGMLVYETFTIDNHVHHSHPKRREFCLAPNELLRLASPLCLLHYDEGRHSDDRASRHIHTAQLVAYKPTQGGSLS